MAETINMPKLGFDMAEGTLVRWVKQIGENINKGDVLAEIETDKATVEVESPASGVVLQQIVDEGSVVPVNAPIAIVGEAGEKVDAPAAAAAPQKEEKAEAAPPSTPAAASTPQASAPADNGHVKASPLAKKIAKENNINLANVQGTGPGGRIVRKDVEAALSSGAISAPGRPMPQPTYQINVTQEDKTVPTTKLRQAIGRRLVESKQTVPHFYVSHEYKMDALMDMRNPSTTSFSKP